MSERRGDEAFVTLATNDAYALGCLVLGNSLRKVNTTRQRVVMVTSGVTQSMKTQLSSVFDKIKDVNLLDSSDSCNLDLLGRPDLSVTFTKLHCWRLTEYKKCVFMDADTLVIRNIDDLFDRSELSAAPDAGWPDCFNSGVFVYVPSEQTYKNLLSTALSLGSFDGADQGLLNLYFRNWSTEDISKHLPFTYNVVSQSFYSYLPAFKQFYDDIKVVHFIGAVKPWHQAYNSRTGKVNVLPGSGHSEEFLQRWWSIFMECVQPSLDPELTGLAGDLAHMTIQGASGPGANVVLDDRERKLQWEQGQADYMGVDRFDNIKAKLDEKIAKPSSASSSPSSTKKSEEKAPEVRPAQVQPSVDVQPSKSSVTMDQACTVETQGSTASEFYADNLATIVTTEALSSVSTVSNDVGSPVPLTAIPPKSEMVLPPVESREVLPPASESEMMLPSVPESKVVLPPASKSEMVIQQSPKMSPQISPQISFPVDCLTVDGSPVECPPVECLPDTEFRAVEKSSPSESDKIEPMLSEQIFLPAETSVEISHNVDIGNSVNSNASLLLENSSDPSNKVSAFADPQNDSNAEFSFNLCNLVTENAGSVKSVPNDSKSAVDPSFQTTDAEELKTTIPLPTSSESSIIASKPKLSLVTSVDKSIETPVDLKIGNLSAKQIEPNSQSPPALSPKPQTPPEAAPKPQTLPGAAPKPQNPPVAAPKPQTPPVAAPKSQIGKGPSFCASLASRFEKPSTSSLKSPTSPGFPGAPGLKPTNPIGKLSSRFESPGSKTTGVAARFETSALKKEPQCSQDTGATATLSQSKAQSGTSREEFLSKYGVKIPKK